MKFSDVHYINQGEGFIPNGGDVPERYVLNAYTAILLFVCLFFVLLFVREYMSM